MDRAARAGPAASPDRLRIAGCIGRIAEHPGEVLLVGLPTDVIPNDWFGRMTPVRSYDVPVLVAVSLRSGLLIASYWGITGVSCPVRPPGAAGATGAAIGWLAIGCRVCNKLVVLARARLARCRGSHPRSRGSPPSRSHCCSSPSPGGGGSW